MVTQEKSRFDTKVEESPQLVELRKLRQTLNQDLYGNVQNLEQTVQSSRFGTTKEGLAKIDQGIATYNDHFKVTIADLAAGLTGDLQEFTQFASNFKNYTAKENFVKFFSKTKAARMRTQRIKQINPKEGLELVLKYGVQLVQEILEVRKIGQESYTKLELNTSLIANKIKEYEPKESALKEKLDIMEGKYKEKDELYQKADAATQAVIGIERDNMHKDLLKVRLEYDAVLTTYKQAQEAYKSSELSRDSFEQMVRDLGRQAKMIQEKMDNVTQIYAAAPNAVKVMMTTKGMESLDKVINASTAESVNIITEAAQDVSDATLKREETPLVDPEVVRGFYLRVQDMLNDFNTRYGEIRENSRKSENERYNLNKDSN